MKSYVDKRDKEFKFFDQRMDDKQLQIDDLNKELDEMDIKATDLEDNIKTLEHDK